MNSVALPVSATAPALGAEVDLIRQAARGNEESFEELYRRHSQTAWRLAQAVALDREGAVGAVGEGFGRSLRSLRRQSRLDSETYRPLLLAAVYKAALDHVHSHTTPTPAFAVRSIPKGKGAHSKGANAALLDAAFRSLPERWRAALWLADAESMDADRIAPILGVSATVATQLITRGRRGLSGRFTQARRPEPDHLGSALRGVAVAVPANLADEAVARWRALVTDAGARFAPLTGWMNERAVRPLWVSVGGLMGLGLIGLGIVGQGSSVNNGPVATGSLPAANGAGVNPLAARGLAGLAGGIGSVAPNSGLNPFFLGSSGGGSGSTFGNTLPNGSVASGNGSNTPTGGGNPPPSQPGTGIPNLPISLPPASPPVSPQGTTVVNSPLLSVTNSGTTTNLNVNSATTGPVATVTVGCPSSGVGLNVAGIPVGCQTGTPPPPSGSVGVNPPPATSPSGGASSTGLAPTVQKVTNTVNGLVSGL
ncbi:MAG TPA: sigma-70 family RNA polymerase sigma factor [Acidimicrobiales bacterium]|nr:sigma-70 family RNA polymerase sigma factor [Acidimicrobiales bacterium]